jgi:hypothetical protein
MIALIKTLITLVIILAIDSLCTVYNRPLNIASIVAILALYRTFKKE